MADLPFELHAHGAGGFVIFEVGEQTALPLLALTEATLRGVQTQEMVLAYVDRTVVIEGTSLDELFEHLLSGRVKRMRAGSSAECAIDRIVISEAS